MGLLVTALACARAGADANQVGVLPEQYRNAGVDEHPDGQVPLDLQFYDENGQVVPLSTYFQPGRPVILQMGYFDCPKLCDVISRDLIESARQIDLVAGKDFDFVFVSINPAESPNLAAVKRLSYIEAYDKPGQGDGFHCLVGSPPDIKALAAAVGFRYNEVDIPGEFAHPAVLFVLTPEGKISRYLYGVSVPPETLRLSLVEASAGKIGTSFDRLALMFCCYDLSTGKYSLMAFRVMQLAAVLTVAVLGSSMLWMWRHGPRSGRTV
jgi:protein SCO1/2